MPPKAVPAAQRRFDSIGLLIQGGEKCGAACFDGTSLLLATNKNQPSVAVTKIKEFLHFIATSSFALSRKSRENQEFAAEYKALKSNHEAKKAAIIQHMQDHVILEVTKSGQGRGKKIKISKSFDDSPEYKKTFLKALDKVTQSIRHTYLQEKSDVVFPRAAVDAMRDNNIIILPRPGTRDNYEGLHAELRVVQDLITRGKLKEKKEYYLGISKRCCRECTHVMASVNKVKADGIGDVLCDLIVRDEKGHGKHFPAPCPKFLETQIALKDRFVELMKKNHPLAVPLSRNPFTIFRAVVDMKGGRKQEYSESSGYEETEKILARKNVVVIDSTRALQNPPPDEGGEWKIVQPRGKKAYRA